MNRFTYFTRFRSTHGTPDLQAMGRSALFSFVVFLQAGCATPAIVPIGVLQLASEQGAEGRTFGGISGLDHHPTSKAWLLISDDRSTHGPARFYEAVLNWRQDRLVNAQIRGQRPLQNDKALIFLRSPTVPTSMRWRTPKAFASTPSTTASSGPARVIQVEDSTPRSAV